MTAPSTGDRIYAFLLRLYPRSFRERYGSAMREFHRDRMRARTERRGSHTALWFAVIIDALRSAASEHLRALALRVRAPRLISHQHKERAMRLVLQDLTYAVRSLARRPAFALVVIATVALGVGANAAIFSVVNGVLLRPLPYPHAEQLVTFGHEPPQWLTSDPDFLDYQRDVTSLVSLAAYTQALATLTSNGDPDRVRAVRVSEEFFRTMGTAPAIGRVFAPEEFRGNPPTSIVLSHAFWTRRFGGDRSIVNRTLVVNGVQRTVVGVMPPHFNFPEARTDLWVPMPRFNRDSLGHRANHYLFMVGRMKPGIPIDRLQNEAKVVATRIMTDNPSFFNPLEPLRPHIEGVHDQLVRHARPYLIALLGTVGFVLLIACANVANLMLARAEGRRREMAVRSALGATRRRLLTQMFTEGALVACVGGAVGLGMAWAATRVLLAVAPSAIPRLDEVRVDWRVMVFTLGTSLVTGLLISLVPAIRAARDGAFDALKAGGRAAGHGATRGARRVLVIAEVALAVIALSGASMLLRSLWHLEHMNTGFVARGVLTARVSISARDYNNGAAATFFQQLIDRIGALPGVQSASAAGWLPVVDAGGLWGYIPEGRAYGSGSDNSADQPSAVPQQVTPGYFSAAGIPLKAGRQFTAADRDGTEPVAIVSAEMAKETWPGDNPIGKRFRVGSGTELPLMTVVGVAGDIRARGFTDTPEPTMYFPHAQSGRTTFFMPRGMSLVIRTNGSPISLASPVRQAVRALDPAAPVSEVRTMEEVVGTSVATRRFSTSLLTGFAILALVLAGIGTYGVIAYGVAQRTYEIGVRMALGAERSSVVRLVMIEGIRMCALGLAIGLGGSVAIARAMRALLVDVPAVDAPSLMGTSVLLCVVALLASAIPAWRALGVSPTEALRGT
jgi:putative ABC transport system permease protein